ncbi:MAG: hypothetical protein QXT98_07720 [Archaeoglobaceae archaeon]
MRAKTKRKIKKILRFSPKIYALVLIMLASAIVIAGGSGSRSTSENTVEPVNSTNVVSITGETIFTKICMKCHTTPEKYKSFTLYFGKPESMWEVGIKKMITVGNAKLSADQIKLVARYLEETYRGG